MKKIKRIIGPAMLLVATLATYTAVQRSTDIGQGGPLILADANTVAHVYWNGTALIDAKGNAWTANGSIPMVPKAGKTPAGAGPFSATQFYSLANPNVLQFAGDFSLCVVFVPTTVAAEQQIASTWSSPTTGWLLSILATSGAARLYTASGAASSGSVVIGAVNVVCAGRSGGNSVIKLNLGAYASGAAAYTAGSNAARLGVRGDGFGPFTGTLHEIWASTTTPSDALFIDIMNRVKSQAGVTAW